MKHDCTSCEHIDASEWAVIMPQNMILMEKLNLLQTLIKQKKTRSKFVSLTNDLFQVDSFDNSCKQKWLCESVVDNAL